MPDTRKTNKANAPLGNADATPALSAGLERTGETNDRCYADLYRDDLGDVPHGYTTRVPDDGGLYG